MTLTFGTAGLRGPMRAGPDGMNNETVAAATTGIVAWLQGRCLGGGQVVVGYDARHHSAEFAIVTAEIFAGAGFPVTLLPAPLPTPVTAFAARALDAVVGVQITASHNPPGDNGYKVYVSGGAQLNVPGDREIEALIASTPPATRRISVVPSGNDLLERYLARVATLPRGDRRDLRIALTPMHGVGGETAVAALNAVGFNDIHVVETQFAPDPDFPTVAFPNPEEPGATDLLLGLAANVAADIAIALDPDADRCAVGIPGPDGWRMLRGDETGVLLGDYVMTEGSLVATTVVSSRLLSKVAAARGARYAETLTGFKWLVRAGDGLVYAYEEALGHCVDPATVRDKDGISAAVLIADLAATLKHEHRGLQDVLDGYAVEFGLHTGSQVSRRVETAPVMAGLRANPPAGFTVTDLAGKRGPMRTDALIFDADGTRAVVRPSGTEPKLKYYFEVVEPVAGQADLPRARARAAARLARAELTIAGVAESGDDEGVLVQPVVDGRNDQP